MDIEISDGTAEIVTGSHHICEHLDIGQEGLHIADNLVKGIDPEWLTLWNHHGTKVSRLDQASLEDYRKDPSKYSLTYPTYEGPPVFCVRDITIPVTQPSGHITIRVYIPASKPGQSRLRPGHINFHGGGWVLGSLASEAAWCRHICNDCDIVVVDVDYRLAPEYQYPTAIFDCWDAVQWIIDNHELVDINPRSISIGGLSAGGHMTAVLAHLARDAGIPLKLQLLIVPGTDFRYVPINGEFKASECQYESVIELQNVPWGPLDREQWFLNQFLGIDPVKRKLLLKEWMLTPVLAPDLSNLAPAHVVTAEYDLERDEGEYYADLLEKAGTKVTRKRYLGVPHAFPHYNHPTKGLSKSQEFIKDTAQVLKKAHAISN